MSIVQRINSASDNSSVSLNTSPTLAKIELTGKCTLSCRFCNNVNMRKYNQRQKLLSTEDFELVLENLKSITSIKEVGLFYMGESGLHPLLKEFYKKLKEARYFTFLTTNGTYIKYILEAIPYIDSLKVSWNYKDLADFIEKTGVSAQVYFSIQKNIDTLYKECHKYNRTLAISTILDSEEKMYDGILKQLKFDEHYFIPLQNQNGIEENGAPGVVGESINPVKPIPCWSLFKGVYVDVDLNVRTCCYGHDKIHIIGNLREEKLSNLISDEKLIRYKKSHLSNKIPSICTLCLNTKENK